MRWVHEHRVGHFNELLWKVDLNHCVIQSMSSKTHNSLPALSLKLHVYFDTRVHVSVVNNYQVSWWKSHYVTAWMFYQRNIKWTRKSGVRWMNVIVHVVDGFRLKRMLALMVNWKRARLDTYLRCLIQHYGRYEGQSWRHQHDHLTARSFTHLKLSYLKLSYKTISLYD